MTLWNGVDTPTVSLLKPNELSSSEDWLTWTIVLSIIIRDEDESKSMNEAAMRIAREMNMSMDTVMDCQWEAERIVDAWPRERSELTP